MIYYYYYFIFELFYWRCEYFNAISATKCFGIPKDLPRLIEIFLGLYLLFPCVVDVALNSLFFFIFNSLVKV